MAIIAALAAKVIADKIVKKAVSTVGSAVASIASADSDPSKPIAALGDAATKAGEKLGTLGPIAITFGESMKSLAAVMQNLDRTAERYGEYSPQIAMAQGIAEVRHTMGDLRRAQFVGLEMSRYVLARSEVQQKWEDIKVKLLNRILPLITRVLEILEVSMNAVDGVADEVAALVKPLSDIATAINKWFNMQEDNQRPIEDPTEQILRNPNFAEGGAWVPDL